MPISKLPNFKEKCLPQNCLRQGKIPKSAYLKYFQTQLKSAYRQILHCSRVPSSRYCCIPKPRLVRNQNFLKKKVWKQVSTSNNFDDNYVLNVKSAVSLKWSVGFQNDMKITPVFTITFSSKMLIKQCFTSLENTFLDDGLNSL